MRIWINGRACELPSPATVADAVGTLRAASSTGIAVAVDGEVVPRARWGSRGLRADARVEVLTAVQGG
jgi:sulfur carrier protein